MNIRISFPRRNRLTIKWWRCPKESSENAVFNDIEKDLLGELEIISMGSAATALSTIIGKK